jgi:hypothetical protein
MQKQYSVAENALQRVAGQDVEMRLAFKSVVAAAADPPARPQAVTALERLTKRRSPSEIALWLALIGERDSALQQMQAAYESGADANLPFLLLHPAFDSIRARPEYQKILDELHMIPDADS